MCVYSLKSKVGDKFGTKTIARPSVYLFHECHVNSPTRYVYINRYIRCRIVPLSFFLKFNYTFLKVYLIRVHFVVDA